MDNVEDDSPITISDVKNYIISKTKKIRGQKQLKTIPPSPSGGKLYQKYYKKVMQRAERAGSRLFRHAVSFAAINSFLLLINVVTGSSHPWFFYPLGATAVLLLNHIIPNSRHRRRKKEFEELPPMSDPQVKLIKRIHRKETGLKRSLATAAGLSGYLVLINLITSPMFPWSLIASGGLALTVLFQSLFNFSRRRKLKQKFNASFSKGSIIHSGFDSENVVEAKRLHKIILDHLDKSGNEHPLFDDEVKPMLVDYLERIIELDKREKEFSSILTGIPVKSLNDELSLLKTKHAASDHISLKKEYSKTIKEYELQIKSFEELQNQKEIISLKLQSSINVLKRMHLDLVRAKGLSLSEDKASINLLKEKGSELSYYLDDLQKGYDEIDQ